MKVYLPTVQTEGKTQAASQGTPCGMSANEDGIAVRMAAHPEQRRKDMTCHPLLAQVARAKARDMAERHYTGHADPEGHGPNYLLGKAGYKLPTWYSQDEDGNNVESLLWGGEGDPERAWNAWMASPLHRAHLLATDAFYAVQTCVGVGHVYVEGSAMGNYWVVLTCPPEE